MLISLRVFNPHIAGGRVWHRLRPLDRAVSATSHEVPINEFAPVAMCGTRPARVRTNALRTRGCPHRLQQCRPRRLGNIAERATRRVRASQSAVGWAAPRASNSRLVRPPVGAAAAAVDHSPKLSLLRRARFWPVILMGHSRADSNRRLCGLAPVVTASDHSAKLPCAQGAAF